MTPMVTLFGAGCRNSLMSMDQQFISRGCWQARSGACARCIRQRHDVNHGEADAFEGQPMEQVAPRTLASASRTVSALVFCYFFLIVVSAATTFFFLLTFLAFFGAFFVVTVLVAVCVDLATAGAALAAPIPKVVRARVATPAVPRSCLIREV